MAIVAQGQIVKGKACFSHDYCLSPAAHGAQRAVHHVMLLRLPTWKKGRNPDETKFADFKQRGKRPGIALSMVHELLRCTHAPGADKQSGILAQHSDPNGMATLGQELGERQPSVAHSASLRRLRCFDPRRLTGGVDEGGDEDYREQKHYGWRRCTVDEEGQIDADEGTDHPNRERQEQHGAECAGQQKCDGTRRDQHSDG